MSCSEMRKRSLCVESLETRTLFDSLVNNNAGATGTSQFTQSEPSLVVFGNTVVVAFDDSGSFAGSSNKFSGFSRSTNGGATFTDGGSLPTNTNGDAGDALLARDQTTGRIYLATISFSGGNIQVFRSDDNAATWQLPVNGTPPTNGFEDVHSIVVDNFAGAGNGNVYLASRNFGAPNGIRLFRSTDGGNTFGPTGGVTLVTGNQFPKVVVGPDHSVYVFWYAGTSLQMRKSVDQGLTFAPSVTVATGIGGGLNGDMGLTGIRQGTTTAASFRSNAGPRVAVNPVSGHLYCVYANDAAGTDKADIFMVQSTNGGATWSASVRVNDDATLTDQWQPAIAVSPGGTRLGVFYYSRQLDTAGNNLYRFYGRLGTISGSTVTFATSFPVSDVSSLPEFGRDNVINSVYMGDYNHVEATNGAFHAVWADNRDDLPGGSGRKDPNVYYDRIAFGPEITNTEFLFDTLPHRIRYTFSQNVGASLTTADFQALRINTGQVFSPTSVSYNSATNQATVSYNQFGSANFIATAFGAGITNTSGESVDGNQDFNYFFLLSDYNHDRAININDFSILASNFNRPGTFSSGDGNYDGIVNINDFSLMAARFNTVLAAPADLPRAVAPVYAQSPFTSRFSIASINADNERTPSIADGILR